MKIGMVVKRYPGGDPENGPAYAQRYLGDDKWECAPCKPEHEPMGLICSQCMKVLKRNDPRKMKRMYRAEGLDDPLQYAYEWGHYAKMMKWPTRNPFPPGVRHDEWERGYAL